MPSWLSPPVLLACLGVILTLVFDPKYTWAWYSLVTMGREAVEGHENVQYRNECDKMALEMDPKAGIAWYNLALRCQGGIVGGRQYSKDESYKKALQLDPKFVFIKCLEGDTPLKGLAWYNLGIVGGGIVRGLPYSPKQCFMNALELKPEYAVHLTSFRLGGLPEGHLPEPSTFWTILGAAGGGRVGSRGYSSKDCYLKALELDLKNEKAWHNLGTVGGGRVGGLPYSAKTCFAKALQLNPKFADFWVSLGTAGGGRVGSRGYSSKDCFMKALELDPKNEKASAVLFACFSEATANSSSCSFAFTAARSSAALSSAFSFFDVDTRTFIAAN